VNTFQDFNVTIKGIVPLMHNRYPLDAMQITKKKPRGTLFNPTEKAKECLYIDTKGEIYQPSDHIEGALIQVGSTKSVPGQGKKTYKDQMKTNIAVMPTEIPFPNGKDYTVDTRLCVIPATRGRIPVARPRWDNWQFNFTIRVFDETLLDRETVKELLETAGKTKGIGTYRPKFGRFEVTQFDTIVK
jgi:hypothetical protein